MPKPYDAASKGLVEAYPGDWLRLAGIDPGGPVELVDSNVSTVIAEADKVIRVDRPTPWIAHVEWQSSRDPDLPARLLAYNSLLYRRHELPVRSVVILLRRSADKDLSGQLDLVWPGDVRPYHTFRYDVIRAWERSVEDVLAGGLGTLPLAPISDLGATPGDAVIRRMTERINTQPRPIAELLWTATALLMGLTYDEAEIRTLLRGVRNMEDSVYYQMIIREGMAKGLAEGQAKGLAEGRAKEARAIVLRLGQRRFGPADEATRAALGAIADIDRIEALADRVLDATNWADLLAGRDAG